MSTAGTTQGATAPLGGTGTKHKVRIPRRPVHGVLLLDKPLGLSSNQALQRVKWLLRAEKAGHTGTLDPLATGVLPLCFGAATKFSQMHLDADKTYETVVRLGVKTTTADAEGAIVSERTVHIEQEALDAVVKEFTGAIQQIPPMHSALKKDGRALYEYARAGVEVERAPRDVTIYGINVLEDLTKQAPPAIKLVVSCSKGTYIRTLGEDIGEALGCGGHLVALRRIRTGSFHASECISIETLEAMSEQQRLQSLMPVDVLLKGHDTVMLDSENAARFISGMRRRGQWPEAEQVVVYAQESRALLGTAKVVSGELIPVRLMSPLDIREMQDQNEQLLRIET